MSLVNQDHVSTPAGRPPEQWLGFQLNTLGGRVRARTYAELAALGFPFRALGLMLALADCGEASQRDLAARLGMDRSTISALVDTLVCAGLLSRCADSKDRRNNRLRLTEEGRRRTDIASRRAAAVEESVLAPLTDEERATLSALLRRLMATTQELR